MQDLIIVKQLPQIEEHLKELSIEIEKKVEQAKSLICTDENVKTIKQVRADLNKEFREVEQQRKAVKEQVLAPYMQFEKVYNEYVSDNYRSADIELKNKIDSVESELKAKKEQDVKDYFETYKSENNIDFITYEQARINVTLTASMKSLKEQAKSFIDKIVDDLKLINTQQNQTEILVEYKKHLNVSRAITDVMDRKKAIETENLKREEQKVVHIEMNQNHKITERSYGELEKAFNREMEETQIKQKIYTITFTVSGTAPRLKQLKDYLLREGYQYE